jgi:hypothetical protein
MQTLGNRLGLRWQVTSPLAYIINYGHEQFYKCRLQEPDFLIASWGEVTGSGKPLAYYNT